MADCGLDDVGGPQTPRINPRKRRSCGYLALPPAPAPRGLGGAGGEARIGREVREGATTRKHRGVGRERDAVRVDPGSSSPAQRPFLYPPPKA